MEYPKRKPTRIPGYDYSTQNYYFITICTYEKKCIFGPPGKNYGLGRFAADCMEKIPEIYPDIRVEKYIVMPNHVHAILVLGIGPEKKTLPQLTEVIGKYKAVVTKMVHRVDLGLPVWQRSFYDHVIRNQADFENIWNYIDGNPQKWEDDCFFPAK